MNQLYVVFFIINVKQNWLDFRLHYKKIVMGFMYKPKSKYKKSPKFRDIKKLITSFHFSFS